MGKYELKTQKNSADVQAFLSSVTDISRKQDARKVTAIMQEITGEKPAMWGASIIGFGSYTYKNRSGFEGEWMRIGLSPRKQNLTLYIMNGFKEYDSLLQQLGKHKTGKSCLYINSLEDIDLEVLRELITKSYNSPSIGEVQS